MLRVKPVGTLVMVMVIALNGPIVAQSVGPGRWTGSLVLDNGVRVEVELTLRSDGDSLFGSMKSVTGPENPLLDLRFENEGLAFQWGGFSCVLARQGGSRLEGTCHTSDGSDAEMALAASEDDPASETADRAADVLTTEDLLATQATNVYDAIRRLRPRWLRARGRARIGYNLVVKVYMESQPMGDVGVLKTLEPGAVGEARFYNATEATMRFGTDNEGGVIVLTRRRG